MSAIGLEFAKLKRKRIWLTLALIVGFELVWAVSGLMMTLMRDYEVPKDTAFVVSQASGVIALFAPIVATVIVSRLSAMEHDGRMMPTLFAANQSRSSLFFGKFFVAFVMVTLGTVVYVAVVTLVASARGVTPDLGLTGTWLLGLVVAGIAVIAIQLVLALLFERQAVTLTVGVLGGLVGSFAAQVPPQLSVLIPWQYAGLVNPMRSELRDGTIIGFVPVENLGAYLAIIVFVGVGCVAVTQTVFAKMVSR
ncbi:ABC transporter permease [Microbacterium sp.]|uniref:ABC transporter permease n=1 Tax=Microbacterium sp. TaxID=51671 RepID=UPI0039E5BCB4